MQAIILVMKQVGQADRIMSALAEAGIHGATVVESSGMARSLTKLNENIAMVQLLRGILSGEDDSHKSKTLFVVVKDEQVDDVRSTIREITGDLSKPNAGIMFGVPVSFVEGIS